MGNNTFFFIIGTVIGVAAVFIMAAMAPHGLPVMP